jgi:hypothetical protein
MGLDGSIGLREVAGREECSDFFLQGSGAFGALQIVREPPAPNFAHGIMF